MRNYLNWITWGEFYEVCLKINYSYIRLCSTAGFYTSTLLSPVYYLCANTIMVDKSGVLYLLWTLTLFKSIDESRLWRFIHLTSFWIHVTLRQVKFLGRLHSERAMTGTKVGSVIQWRKNYEEDALIFQWGLGQ